MARGGARKVSREERRKRLVFAERALVTLPSVKAVVHAFVTEFKTTERCAEKWIERVRDAWDAEAAANPHKREKVRTELDRAAKHVFAGAMGRGKFLDANGALKIRMQLNGLMSGPEQADGDVTVVFNTKSE